jgi:hypothetical protein
VQVVSAEVRPHLTIDDARRRAGEAYAEVVRAERAEAAAVKEVERSRADLQRARLDCGRELAAIRKAWPRSGPRAKGWGDFLAEIGISQRVAHSLMVLAGYVEEKLSEPDSGGSEIPSRREIAEARREQREAVAEEPTGVLDGMNVGAVVPAEPRVAALAVSHGWQAQLAELVEDMQRYVKAAFAKAEQIERICVEHEASLGSPSLLTTRSAVAAVRATASSLLSKMGGPNG